MFATGVRLTHPIFKFPGARGSPPEDGAAPLVCRIELRVGRIERFGIKALGIDPSDLPQLPNAPRPAVADNFQTHTRPKSAFELVQVFNHAAPSFPCPGHTAQNSVPG